ncbi:Uncharacterized protein BP5553_03472 [Venustampulla echinocandica]|uniref:Uncharacterized protein n=1 Tax=Venustampulla echinocandica TaxID=2656787 RepID=A0A370TUC1_9HELO|nr:Uncharacterized protein BP5553_03472 [Venustampulla echinocandica]RDL39132.1 Uncharacterized protein BP5553_03472 [Venustampulla echinocandica]
MALHLVDPNPIPDLDSSTAYTAATPPESVAADLLDEPFGGAKLSSSSVPWPGSTFLIRSVESGHMITLLDGQVVLAPPGGRGYIHWECVETKGWLGFRDCGSSSFLGHNGNGRLRCSAKRQDGWENFCVRMRPEGGYVLLMTHWERLWQVGTNLERGVESLAKVR